MPSIIWSGVEQLKMALAKRVNEAPSAMGQALYVEAERIMTESRERVPVDKGPLRGSGIVLLPEINANGAEVEFGYGGAASEYAVIQHERLDYSHTVGEAKFLERPTLEAADGLEARLARIVKSRLE